MQRKVDNMRIGRRGFSLITVGLFTVCCCGLVAAAALTPEQRLGKELFVDPISTPAQAVSCASCHAPQVGFVGPNTGINLHGGVYRGAVPTRFGNRKPPSAAYATLSPVFHFDDDEGLFVGGNFWDGRATGDRLGNPAADQAGGPFLNPVEQNMPDKQSVCMHVAGARYADLFREVWGADSLDCSSAGVELTYDRIALSIAAYEDSPEVNAFSSKYDRWLVGTAELTTQETWGLELFNGKAMCAACHISEVGPNGEKPLFTDYTYDNLGVPRNPENPFYQMDTVYLDDGSAINPLGRDWVDYGLGEFLANQSNPDWAAMADESMGKQKVPTLRNVAKVFGHRTPKAFGHNAYFKSLESIVHFYNTRDAKPVCPDPFTSEKDALAAGCWPAPEVGMNVNITELGNLGLTAAEEAAVVAFLHTLSDGYLERGVSRNRAARPDEVQREAIDGGDAARLPARR
ncbi:MAG TPA: cytochrome c peroxidase [Candidatus Polarisedimenticolaceae bacterium]|nr:cytochrome c peroxidase [Candidatus Polarisedimenticolaceae bacterium]